jgi:hypothetical protein
MSKLLNQLTITTKPKKNKLSSIEKRQQKLIAKLEEQQEMAKCHMLYLDGVYAEDNYGKTRFDEKHPCFSLYGQPGVVLIHSR